MNALRQAPHLARLVLAGMVLALLAAMLSPWLTPPQRIELLCSADGQMKAVVVSDAGELLPPGHTHGLECPLCLPLHAPPPAPYTPAVHTPPATQPPPLVLAARHSSRTPLPWHSRAPPARA